jgi:hypothetical protein
MTGSASIDPFGLEVALKELSKRSILQILMPSGGAARYIMGSATITTSI